jgi:hypothetical protein
MFELSGVMMAGVDVDVDVNAGAVAVAAAGGLGNMYNNKGPGVTRRRACGTVIWTGR